MFLNMSSPENFSKAENEVGSLMSEPNLAMGDHYLPLSKCHTDLFS